MCLAIPMQIKKIDGFRAVVEMNGVEKNVDLSMLEEPCLNDYVIVHAGFAIQKLDEHEALESLKLFDEIYAALDAQLEEQEKGNR